MIFRRQMLLVLAVGVLLNGAQARAQSGEAERAWHEGEALFAKSKYKEALGQFAQGYALSHRSGFLFNMAECARLMNDKAQARQLYLRYLTEHPTSKRQAEARERCDALGPEPCVVATPAVPPTPVPAPARPAPRVEPAPAPVAAPAPYLPPPVEQPRRVEQPKPFYKKWPLWVGVGAVLVAGGVTAAVLATRSTEKVAPDGDYSIRFGNQDY